GRHKFAARPDGENARDATAKSTNCWTSRPLSAGAHVAPKLVERWMPETSPPARRVDLPVAGSGDGEMATTFSQPPPSRLDGMNLGSEVADPRPAAVARAPAISATAMPTRPTPRIRLVLPAS